MTISRSTPASQSHDQGHHDQGHHDQGHHDQGHHDQGHHDQGHGARERVWDTVLALLVAALAVSHVTIAPPARTDVDPLGYLLVVVASLVLAARRRAPVAVLLLSTACVLAYQMVGYPGVAAGLPVLVAIYTAVRAGHRLIAGVVTGIALAKGTAATMVMSLTEQPVREVLEGRIMLAGWLIASGVIGEAARKQHAYLHQVEERAAEAERSREEAARRRAGEERLRIARELHDSLTHSISVIKVQAGVAVHLARKRGDDVPETLVAIQEASNDASRELRATLEVLRSDGHDQPASSIEGIGGLLTRSEQAGVSATVIVEGQRRALPPEVDRAAYRIIQEALTNVVRHAAPAEASVRLTYGADRLTVQVDDNGQNGTPSPPVPGVGLLGMRERVADLGGRLVAEPRAVGGFTVRAELPFREGVPGATVGGTS
jgi:signal transduction histidine kinase